MRWFFLLPNMLINSIQFHAPFEPETPGIELKVINTERQG